MTIVSEIIIIGSPFVFGLTVWLAKELYDNLKTDVAETKRTVHRVENKQIEHETKINNMDAKLTQVCGRVDDVRKVTHEIDKRTNGIDQLNGTVKALSDRVDKSDQQYGKVLVILDGIAVKLGLKIRRSGS